MQIFIIQYMYPDAKVPEPARLLTFKFKQKRYSLKLVNKVQKKTVTVLKA